MDTIAESVATVPSAPLVADARDAARAFLDRLRQPAMTAEAADTVVLVVSELVTNALRHGGGACTVELAAPAEGLEVAVHDTSPTPRACAPLTWTADWPMVNRLARATAVTRRASGGKTVSALLAW